MLDYVLPGIGYTLDPDFSFVKIAAPYAQVKIVHVFFTLQSPDFGC